jgi:hypothetical protein
MRFVERLKIFPLHPTRPQAVSEPDSIFGSSWRIERMGEFGGYTVSGWRYSNLAIWHVEVCSLSDGNPAQAYVVSAGELFPASFEPAERFATLHLIDIWETDDLQ